MSIFYDEINARIEYLTGIIYEKRENLLDIPKGNLRISVKRGHPHYYQSKTKGDTKGKYIKNDNIELARALAQKDYDLRVIKAAERELFHLKKIAAMEGRAAESIYGGFGPERKKLTALFKHHLL